MVRTSSFITVKQMRALGLSLFALLAAYGCSGSDFAGGSALKPGDSDDDSISQGSSTKSKVDGDDDGEDAGDGADSEDSGSVDSNDGGTDNDGDDGIDGDDSDAEDDEISTSNGRVTGFLCPGDLSDANGDWAGTWAGIGPEGVLAGTVTLTMTKRDKTSLDVKDYNIKGGYVGNGQQIQQVDNFNFVLKCDDASFPLTQVTWVDGKPYYVILKFTKQTWDPPRVSGVGLGGPVSTNPTPGGFGGWNLKKK